MCEWEEQPQPRNLLPGNLLGATVIRVALGAEPAISVRKDGLTNPRMFMCYNISHNVRYCIARAWYNVIISIPPGMAVPCSPVAKKH